MEIVAVASNIVGLKEAMKMQRATALFVRSCDNWEENVDRCQRLQRMIDLSQMSDEKFETFYDGIRRLLISLQLKPVPLEVYCKKKVKTAQMDPNDFFGMMSKFMQQQTAGLHSGDSMSDVPEFPHGGDDVFFGSQDGHFDSAEASNQRVHAMTPDRSAQKLAADFAEFMNAQQCKPKTAAAKPFGRRASSASPACGSQEGGVRAAVRARERGDQDAPVRSTTPERPVTAGEQGSGNPAPKKNPRGASEVS